jgi:tetratricopeptide (TPR) repeat protein
LSPGLKPTVSAAIGAALLAVCLFAAYWSVRFAVADIFYHQNTLASLRRAVAIEPDNAAYWSLLAEQTESVGLNPDDQLQKAAQLSPLESRYWVRLGFRAEVEQNYPQAEKFLLHAAQVDRKFDPSWALMNFYFRRNNVPEFWRWTDRAFDLSYGDLTPMFQLAWNITSDADLIAKHIPSRPEVETSYLWFLVNSNRIEASVPVALKVAAYASDDTELNPLLAWWEHAYATQGAAALSVWNTLCDRKLLPYQPLHPGSGKLVTNGDFAHIPIQRGSDWRLATADALSLQPDPSSHQLAINFSGKEAEDLVLAEQWLPVDPGRHYIVKSSYQSPGGSPLHGINWTVSASPPRDQILARSEDFTPGPDLKPVQVAFDSLDNRYVRLSLWYKRPLGSTRAEGTLTIGNITSEVAAP